MRRMKLSRPRAVKAFAASLLAVIAAVAGAKQAWAISYSSGHVLYVAYGSGGGPELVVDIGDQNVYRTATTTFNVTQVKSADFSTIIGLSRPNVFVGLFGVRNVSTRDGMNTANGPTNDLALINSSILGAVNQADGFAITLQLYGSTIVGTPEAVSFSSNTVGSYESTLNALSKGSIAGSLAYNVETRFSDATGTRISSPVKIRFYRAERNPFTGLTARGCIGFFTLATNGTISYSPDADCDLLPDDVDHCNGVNDPNNTDTDGDQRGVPCDCNDANAQIWSAPTEVRADHFAVNKTNLSWTAPLDIGGTLQPLYDVFKATVISPSTPAYTCLAFDTSSLSTNDGSIPPASRAFFYLIRAQNGCGNGALGTTSTGAPRVVPNCP